MATMNITNVTITSQNVVDVKIPMRMHLFYRGFLDYPYYTQLSRKRKCSIVNISCCEHPSLPSLHSNHLKNKKFVGSGLKRPSDGLLITLPSTTREEEPPPSRLYASRMRSAAKRSCSSASVAPEPPRSS